MKYNILIIVIAMTLTSYKVKNEPELTAEKVVNFQLYGNDLKGDFSEVIERHYTFADSTRKLTFEARTKHNKAGLVTQYTSYRLIQYTSHGLFQNHDSSGLRKAYRINYSYKDEKLIAYESFSFTKTGEVPDDSKKSCIKYRYRKRKPTKATYRAHRYGKFSHKGKIKVLDNQHATESIKYRSCKQKPILYEIECDENFHKTRSITNEIYQGKERSDTTSFIYKNGYVVKEISGGLTQNYSYKFDSKGNWIKRFTKLSTDKIVSEIEREIKYR